jgi:hypothetical protein
MSIFWDYRPKAKKKETPCSDCVHSNIRWWSSRLECKLYNRYAVAKNGTCSCAEIKEAAHVDEDR